MKKNEFLLSEEENQILDAILSLEMYPSATKEEENEKIRQGDLLIPTRENICKRGKLIHILSSSKQTWIENWKISFELLRTKDLIQNDNPKDTNLTYTLTPLGRSQAKHLRRERIGKQFSDTHIRSDQSKAYSSFCCRVYGKDLNQANMMDMVQLDKLLEILSLTPENRVLDLACGVGKIAEHISDITHAHVIGIDIATAAIKHAQKRTQEKRNRLEFRIGDINDLALDKMDVDTVIGIAALHYIEDLNKAIGQIKEILTPNGQMGFFTFQYCTTANSSEILLPENTTLGQILKNNNLKFQTWDFTDKEIDIRHKQLKIAEELMEDFQAEGNKDLIEDRIEECEIDLPRLETGKKRRYLYHIQLSEAISL
ncbi:MAG: class I SAM-dependent methyltransferase [Candidatus Hodarchaeales archaeon]|jgi:ubiquinone/menaquinone biosynthesis C-methylase UbiE